MFNRNGWHARSARLGLRSVVALLGSLVGAPFPCAAQGAAPQLTELTLEQLGEVRVTSVSKQPDAVWRTPVAIHVITAEEIRRSGATSLPDVLRLAPGIEVSRADSDHWTIGIRGLGDQFSKTVLVMIDGRSIYTPLFAGTYWPAYDTVLLDIERVEVIRGPGGTIWGGNAVNGVVNIITKRAADTQGTVMGAGSGNIDRGMAAVRYGGGNGRDLDYRVYAKGFNRGPLAHVDDTDYDRWWMASAGGRVDWTRSAGETISVQGDISGGRHGQRVAISTLSPPASVVNDDPMDLSTANVMLTWRRELAAGNAIQLRAYYDRLSWDAPHFAETRDTLDVDFMHGFAVGARHRVSWGAGGRWSPSTFRQTVPVLDFEPREETAKFYSVYLQDEMEVLPTRLSLTGGAKIEHNRYTGVEVQPSARVLYTPGQTHAFWGAVSRAVRTPSRIEREIELTNFAQFAQVGQQVLPVFLRVAGSDAFESEQMLGLEAGYRTLAVPHTYVDFSVFHHAYDDLASFGAPVLSAELTPPPPRIVGRTLYVNGVEGTADGFEIAPDWRPAPWWQLKGSYSFVALDFQALPNSVDAAMAARYEGLSPRHQTRLQVRFTLPRSVELDAAHRYVSELLDGAVPGYHAVDARLGWSPRPGVHIALNGRNLFGARHVEFPHSPGPAVAIQRSVFASVTWSKR